MNWNRVFISGFLVWLIQLTVADSLMIDTVRPDFIGILIMYWAVKYGRFLGTISGLIFGLIIDFSGGALFFGISPLIYSFTGYLSGNMKGLYTKVNPFYFNFFWVSIFLLQFFIFCIVNYQEILIIDLEYSLENGLGLQFILFPL